MQDLPEIESLNIFLWGLEISDYFSLIYWYFRSDKANK